MEYIFSPLTPPHSTSHGHWPKRYVFFYSTPILQGKEGFQPTSCNYMSHFFNGARRFWVLSDKWKCLQGSYYVPEELLWLAWITPKIQQSRSNPKVWSVLCIQLDRTRAFPRIAFSLQSALCWASWPLAFWHLRPTMMLFPGYVGTFVVLQPNASWAVATSKQQYNQDPVFELSPHTNPWNQCITFLLPL